VVGRTSRRPWYSAVGEKTLALQYEVVSNRENRFPQEAPTSRRVYRAEHAPSGCKSPSKSIEKGLEISSRWRTVSHVRHNQPTIDQWWAFLPDRSRSCLREACISGKCVAMGVESASHSSRIACMLKEGQYSAICFAPARMSPPNHRVFAFLRPGHQKSCQTCRSLIYIPNGATVRHGQAIRSPPRHSRSHRRDHPPAK
jgi:hypothetical protein